MGKTDSLSDLYVSIPARLENHLFGNMQGIDCFGIQAGIVKGRRGRFRFQEAGAAADRLCVAAPASAGEAGAASVGFAASSFPPCCTSASTLWDCEGRTSDAVEAHGCASSAASVGFSRFSFFGFRDSRSSMTFAGMSQSSSASKLPLHSMSSGLNRAARR